MKLILHIFTIMIFTAFCSLGQEGVEPIMGNPQLQQRAAKKQMRASAGTFDSTFIYTPDTIDLPVFDEFSKSKFQVYNAGYSDPGVTSDKVYRLLDMADVPMSTDSIYTTQQTFRLVVDVGNNTVQYNYFNATQVKLGDLSSYPVTHVPTDVYPPFYIYDTIDFANDIPDTIWITNPDVYQDSATQFFSSVNDPDLIWIDDYAFHNYTMAKDPWSLGVATFDGLDENGFPYALGSTLTNYADFLTSKPIDMSAVSAGDSVYFSFLYQAQGFCDPPESSDSLVLEFYAKDLDQWNRIWSTNGIALDDFKLAHIRVDNPDYFKKGFQFRFKNYGALSGSLDHFHLDYVNLRTLSGWQDTVIHDFAFVYPINTLIKTYTSVPWDHWVNNFVGKMTDSMYVTVRNNDNIALNEQDGQTEVYYSGGLEGSYTLLENLLNEGDLNYSPLTTYYSFHDLTSGYHYDETKTGLTQTFDIISTANPITSPTADVRQNDTTYSTQYFQNYYSYDDGTAELAYGPTGSQSQLAIKYTPYEADSLIGVMIHFVPTVQDVSNNLFLVSVWDDNGGEPGNLLYEDDLFFPRQPVYEYDRNIFTTYYFMDTMKVHVGGTFYIGWRQFDPERLGVGLDCNIVNNDKTFYSNDGGVSWHQSSVSLYPGSVMIRPVFSTSFDAVIGIKEEKLDELQVRIFPNPATEYLEIQVENGEFNGAELINLQGQVVMRLENSRSHIGDLQSGVYLVRLKGSSKTYKIIKQ